MSRRPGNRLVVFAISAVAVAIAASIIVAGAARDVRGHGSHRDDASSRAARGVDPPTASPARRLGRHVSSTRATRVARRFAASWRAWDTGRRTHQDAATLRRLSVAAVWQRLRRERARPTASRAPTTPALHSVHAIGSGRGKWRAALVARHPDNIYLGTLLIAATPAGPRVEDVQR